uniref:Uncharacterized protein n=1 Tax=Chenopodium quinoa TaxID=63459 RepID=A0A803LXL6_CHEQI
MNAKQFYDIPAEIQFKILNFNRTINPNNVIKQFQDFSKDVQYNILKRLPVKSLIRLSCFIKDPFNEGNVITYKKEFANVPVGGSHYVIGKSLSIPITHLTANIRSRALGFGYDGRSLDFKVVRIGVLPNDSKHVWAEIYALHSHTWKTVHGSTLRPVSIIMEQGIFTNDRFCKLWVMKEYGESDSWKKIFGINCGDAYGKVLTSLANGNIVVSKSDGTSILYSPKNKSVRSYKKEFAKLDYVGHYVENFVFLGQQRLGGS